LSVGQQKKEALWMQQQQPSKANKKKMKEIADQLGDEMPLVWLT
jgi:hypothetical protein